jgi:hypothetical protein
MYVHTHWGYNHPYAARAWSLEDWSHYLSGLASLGYDAVMLWPLLDCMPPEPNASDRAFLDTIGRVIDLAHNAYGMRFAVTIGPNVIGNAQAGDYAFERRPYFVCEHKVNPRDADDVAGFLDGRRRQLEPLRKADALVMIDSDPGGYAGSTNAEFVDLMHAQASLFRRLNPRGEMVYWMWVGWEDFNRFWAAAAETRPGDPDPEPESRLSTFVDTLTLMQENLPEPWSVFACSPIHDQATDQLGLAHKRLFFPYGLIEGEPTFPLTNYAPRALHARLSAISAESHPRGAMANCQTHCLQLPHTYLFAHFIRGGSPDDADLEGFADRVLPGAGAELALAWQAIGDGDPAAQRRSAEAARRRIGQLHPLGPCSGLLLGDADRFLADLAMNLEVRAALSEVAAASSADADIRAPLRALLACLRPYQQRLGFVDAYYGPLYEGLNVPLIKLDDPRVNAALADFHNWREPAVRNGVLARLLETLAAVHYA